MYINQRGYEPSHQRLGMGEKRLLRRQVNILVKFFLQPI